MNLDSSERSTSTACSRRGSPGADGAFEKEPPSPSSMKPLPAAGTALAPAATAAEEKDPRWRTDDIALARDYRREVFFGWGPFIGRWLLGFVAVNVLGAAFIDGARHSASTFAVAWLALYSVRRRVDRQRNGSEEDVARAYRLFGRAVFLVIGVVAQAVDHFDDALSGEDSSIFNVTAILGLHFVAMLFFRFWWVPPAYRYATIGAIACFVYTKPRLGVFGTREAESLAYLGAMVLGELVGSTIDGMQRKNYMAVRKTNQAVQELYDYRIKVSQREAAREKAARHADSLLNHTLKNVLADGISSVELYEQTSEAKYLNMAKQSMKHGLCWTRRRQSLIMVCQGTYQPRPLLTNLRSLVEEHADGRDLDIIWWECQSNPSLKVEIDPMLFGLALENGISNAIKHNKSCSSRPSVAMRIVERKRSTDHNDRGSNGIAVLLEVFVRNNARPGALFISEEVEERLFEEGMRASNSNGAANSSDGIGLGHAKMMAKLLGGNVSLRQHGNTISYKVSVPTTAWRDQAPSSSAALPSPENSPNSQKGKRTSPEEGTMACDSPKSSLDNVRVGGLAQNQRKLPQSHRKPGTALAATKIRPSAPRSTVADESHENVSKRPRRGMFIDDSLIARKYASKMLMPKILGLNDWLILGENQEQLNLSASFATAMKPDIVIMDENLEFLPEQNGHRKESDGNADAHDASPLLPRLRTGTQMCEEMAKRGVTALLCIRSGNTSPADVKKYIDAGAHCVICKSFANTALAEPLLRAFRSLQEERSAMARGTFDPGRSAFPILLLD